MSERFDPGVQALKAQVHPEQIAYLEFCRTGDIVDVAIHDLDLFCHLLELREVPQWRWVGDLLVANAGGVEGRFQWPVTDDCRRTITVSTVGGRHEVDLVAQRVDGESLAGAWPVAAELAAFVAGEQSDAAVSHACITPMANSDRDSVSRTGRYAACPWQPLWA